MHYLLVASQCLQRISGQIGLRRIWKSFFPLLSSTWYFVILFQHWVPHIIPNVYTVGQCLFAVVVLVFFHVLYALSKTNFLLGCMGKHTQCITLLVVSLLGIIFSFLFSYCLSRCEHIVCATTKKSLGLFAGDSLSQQKISNIHPSLSQLRNCLRNRYRNLITCAFMLFSKYPMSLIAE